MRQTRFQHGEVGLVAALGRVDGGELDRNAVVDEVSAHGERVVALFLSLHFVPVREAVQPAIGEVVGVIHVKISGVELLIHLSVYKVGYLFIQHI